MIAYLPFFFGGGVLIVSTTVVFGRRFASSTGMNSPDFASRPIFLVGIIWLLGSATSPKVSLALGLTVVQTITTTVFVGPVRRSATRRILAGQESSLARGAKALPERVGLSHIG